MSQDIKFFNEWRYHSKILEIKILTKLCKFFTVFGDLWGLQHHLENFLCMLRKYSGYVEHSPRSCKHSALWMKVIRYILMNIWYWTDFWLIFTPPFPKIPDHPIFLLYTIYFTYQEKAIPHQMSKCSDNLWFDLSVKYFNGIEFRTESVQQIWNCRQRK